MLKYVEQIKEKSIAALIPCYHNEYGNATEAVFLEEEAVTIPRTVKTVLKNIAKIYAVDLQALRQKYSEILGCSKAIPVPLHSRFILMPVKVRKVVSKNDSSRGYINYFAIKDVQGEDTFSTVILKNDLAVKCYHSFKNINQHIRNCYYIHQKLIKEESGTEGVSLECLNCPATKADIALILNELREIRKKL